MLTPPIVQLSNFSEQVIEGKHLCSIFHIAQISRQKAAQGFAFKMFSTFAANKKLFTRIGFSHLQNIKSKPLPLR